MHKNSSPSSNSVFTIIKEVPDIETLKGQIKSINIESEAQIPKMK